MNGSGDPSRATHGGAVRLFALLVAAGLALELMTLILLHPVAFLSFVLFGVLTVGAGIWGFARLRRH